ncbi:thioredoxin domain-containing protein [Runella sp. CRIBMP]|uniref:vitamin K epoxide reductase family protein n=1 Tax=Runella sp. CRIBMP TaxID=2683261 RepID=UPI001412AAC7|nr:vitamin K epoxide reductase family protein [Runella sp. CRIBMP]NBB21708.1 thioredoxin domain-containing protein [Runella sp. CRIBMP]
MKLNPSEKNALEATNMLLYLSKVRVTARSLRNAMWQHPDFPSLSALSDVLTDFNVPNMATRLTPDRLPEIPLPAMAHLQVDGGVFVPVRKIGSTVEWLHTQRGWQSDSYNDFVHKWTGVALLIEPTETSGEREYAQNRRREWIDSLRIPFIVSAILLCLGVVLWSLLQKKTFASNLSYYGLLATKLVGAIVSGMLVWYGIDSQNSFLQKVCQINRRSNCQTILQSPVAKVTEWLSWSEVGLFYFAGSLLALALSMWTGNNTQLTTLHTSLFTLTFLSLPYTFWSVYYQWRVAREWCVLCLTVQVLLWVELGIGITAFSINDFSDEGRPLLTYDFSPDSLLYLGGTFAIVPMLWTLVKGHLQKSIRYDSLFREFQKLKFDPDYLQGLMSKQQILPPIFEGMKVIRLGNPNAENSLIMVISPTCATCRHNHLEIKKLLETNEALQVQIILAAGFSDEDIASKVARQVLSLPTDQMGAALHRWFETNGKHYNEWSSKVRGDYRSDSGKNQLHLHVRWLELAGVMTAPTTFLNAVELPKFYQVRELPKLCTYYSTIGIGQFK